MSTELRTYIRFLAQELREAWGIFCGPIRLIWRFLTRPFTDAYKVAIGHPEVLPAREAIGWLAGISIITYPAIASAIYTESWWLLALFIALHTTLYGIRTYIWTIIDVFRDINEYFGDEPS